MRHIKAGDSVYVVFQRRRGDERLTAKEMPVVRVGSRYGYIVRYGKDEDPFELATGVSHHKDRSDRMNGCGFDVYPTEADYLRQQHERAEFNRLNARLVKRYNGIGDLPPKAVAAIHRILDEFGIL